MTEPVFDSTDFSTDEKLLMERHQSGAELLDAPTDHPPGSALKIALLGARYAAGFPMHVDGDVHEANKPRTQMGAKDGMATSHIECEVSEPPSWRGDDEVHRFREGDAA